MYGGISKYLKLVSLALGAVAVVFILAVITIGVVVGPQPASPPVVPTPGAQIIGGTKDAHGCLPGAGYSWCDAKEKCLRVWEESCTSAAPKVGCAVPCKRQTASTRSFSAQVIARGKY